MSKKVLIFSYRFPPFGGIGAVRFTSITKYLPKYGWQPFVYTSDWNASNCRQYDPNFGTEANQYVVHRAKLVSATQAPFNENPKPGITHRMRRKMDRYHRLARELKNWSNWYREGRRVIPELVRQHNGFDAIMATFPTTPALKLGNWTSRRFDIPWVADFRDIIEESHKKFLWLAKQLEQNRVGSSSAMTTVSKPLAAMLRKRYSQPVYSIPNGFDPAEIGDNGRPNHSQDKFQILYTGQLYPPGHPAREGPGLVFEALDRLADQGQIDLQDFEIKLVGTPKQKVLPHLTGYQSESQLVIKEWVARSEIYPMQSAATLLLSLGSRSMQGILTGKIFEYIQTRRPVLSIPRDDDGIGDLLKETKSGRAIDTVDDVADFILDLYQQWKPDRKIPDNPESSELDQYNWQNQVSQFAEILNRVSSGKST